MPTRERVRGAIVEVSELLAELGWEPREVIGPVDESGEDIGANDLDPDSERAQYFLVASAHRANFYVQLPLDSPFASIVYPLNVLNVLGSRLSGEEIESILDVTWDDLDEERREGAQVEAAHRILSNSDPDEIRAGAFALSTYASTALVEYQHRTTEAGFPAEFHCVRALFPYTENLTLAQLDRRITPVIIAGERGRRYVEYSFDIDREDKEPPEFEFVKRL